MNKKLMAVAVASALTAPGLAVAQVGSSPGITLYGRLDETIMNSKFTSVSNSVGTTTTNEVKKGDIYSPGNAIGFRGREDLGGGTALWFQLESGIWPDGRLEASATTGAHFGGRNSGLGVSSEMGDIVLGIWDTPYKVAYGTGNVVNSGGFASSGIIMGNGDSTGALNNALCSNIVSNATGTPVTAANGVCVTEATANNTAFSRRINNSVQYWSPVFNGLQFKLMTALANYQSPGNVQFASGLPKPKEWSANVTWARGPLSLAAGYDLHQGLRPNTATNVTTGNVNPKDTAFQVGGKWNFGIGEVGAGYEKISYGENAVVNATGSNSTKMDVPALVVDGRVNAGPGAVWASYSKTSGGKSCSNQTLGIGSAACGVEAKMLTLGYDYIMSKRTKMYFAYNKIDNGLKYVGTTTVGTAYYYIAGPAANAGNGTAGGLAAGSDVTTIGVGIQHSF
ncbi:MAG TPA: porin [Burkholderiales bacterium]|nr:porin [Burkholderiales bacterium]